MAKGKNIKNNPEPKSCSIHFWLLMIAVIIIIAQSLYLLLIAPKMGCVDKENSLPGDADGKSLVVLVNGEPIYANELELAYQAIPAALKTNDSLDITFNRLVNNKLLLQDASKKGLSVSEKEIDEAIAAFLDQNQLTSDQLEERFGQLGSTMNQFRVDVRSELLLKKEVDELTKDIKAPTETDLQLYYDAAKNNFVTPLSASVRQIMVYANESNNDAQLENIRSIALLINNISFCEAAKQYSEDVATADTCGQYDFTEGQLLPEFEEVVFSSTPSDVKLFQSRIGYHIIHVLNITEPRQLGFDEVKENIRNYFVLANKQAALNDYILALREKAEIVSYLK